MDASPFLLDLDSDLVHTGLVARHNHCTSVLLHIIMCSELESPIARGIIFFLSFYCAFIILKYRRVYPVQRVALAVKNVTVKIPANAGSVKMATIALIQTRALVRRSFYRFTLNFLISFDSCSLFYLSVI